MNVQSVRVSDWDKDGTIVKVSNVTFDDGSEAPGYDLPPGIEEGKPLPQGWELATSKAGKPYIKAPKPNRGGGFGGGAAAHRNTKEGQAYEQERMDRRTALMQAVAIGDSTPSIIENYANSFYAWLRETAGAGGSPTPAAGGDARQGQTAYGEGVAAPREASPSAPPSPAAESGVLPAAGDCIHPQETRRVTASGRTRCGVCKLFVD